LKTYDKYTQIKGGGGYISSSTHGFTEEFNDQKAVKSFLKTNGARLVKRGGAGRYFLKAKC